MGELVSKTALRHIFASKNFSIQSTLDPSGKSLEVTVAYFYCKEIALSSKDALTMMAGCSLPAKGGYGIHPT
jgi:hypothetical protein